LLEEQIMNIDNSVVPRRISKTKSFQRRKAQFRAIMMMMMTKCNSKHTIKGQSNKILQPLVKKHRKILSRSQAGKKKSAALLYFVR
jgi:hypothetical protein